jgi:hypothetical protein
MSAINAALSQIDRVAEEGDLTPGRVANLHGYPRAVTS